MSVSDQSRGWEQPLKATKDTDHFKDLPFATEKPLCSFPAANHQRISVIIYLVNNYDSVPVQTFLSIQQFSKEAGVELSEVIIAYINDSWEAELNSRVIETIRLFATIKVLSAEAETEWKAKLKAIRLTTAEQVLVLHDNMIVNRHFTNSMMSILDMQPTALVYPHLDSMLPTRIYIPHDKGVVRVDELIWQEVHQDIYKVNAEMRLEHIPRQDVRTDAVPAKLPSGALTGEAFMGKREQLLKLLSLMRTDDVTELSLLAWLCGDGIVTTKCSAVIRADNYQHFTPESADINYLIQTFKDYQPLEGSECKQPSMYFGQITRILETKLR